MRIEVHTPPDSLGRQCFTKYWISDYHPGDPRGEHRRAERGQVFFAHIDDHVGTDVTAAEGIRR